MPHVAAFPREQSLGLNVWVCAQVQSRRRMGSVPQKPTGAMATPD